MKHIIKKQTAKQKNLKRPFISFFVLVETGLYNRTPASEKTFCFSLSSINPDPRSQS